jgi:hypothetical protein
MDWTQILTDHGLAVVCVFALAFACWFLLKRILSDHKEDREMWRGAMDKHTDMADERFAKLIDAVAELTTCVKKHDSNVSHQHERILDGLGRVESERGSR